jgi:3-oxoacyl-[acyl-carrier-protein] synthase II
MNIVGMGAVFARGRGIGALEGALERGWVAPTRKQSEFSSTLQIPVYEVDAETLTDRAVLRNMRRADRFSKMAVLAACDAVKDSGIEMQQEKRDLGIILATAFGPQATGFRFLDDIIEYGETRVSPTLFSHSVHNAAASYIASALANRGPTLTVTQFFFSFHQALALAWSWLQEGRCTSVLVGGVEECGTAMEYICSRKLRMAEDGKIRPFDFSASPAAVPGEGSAFFMLSRAKTPKTYCEISNVLLGEDDCGLDADLRIVDADGMSENEAPYSELRDQDIMMAGYAPLFGSMMTGSSFHCASAALMLANQMRYACPVQDNPQQLRLCTRTEREETLAIQCIKYGCVGEKAVVELRR